MKSNCVRSVVKTKEWVYTKALFAKIGSWLFSPNSNLKKKLKYVKIQDGPMKKKVAMTKNTFFFSNFDFYRIPPEVADIFKMSNEHFSN